MKKLCLILTVLYAFGANCSAQSSLNISAQSSLNIAENLLTGDNSTFESSMGYWTCYDSNAYSRASESGRNGNYLKLTNTGAGNDYEKQMEYRLSGHTPAKEKDTSSSSGRKELETQEMVKSRFFFRKTTSLKNGLSRHLMTIQLLYLTTGRITNLT